MRYEEMCRSAHCVNKWWVRSARYFRCSAISRPVSLALLSFVLVWQTTAVQAIEVTNETYCVICDSFDPTLPAQPKSDADYAAELKFWMGQLGAGDIATKQMAQWTLDKPARPFGDETLNVILNGENKGSIYNAGGNIKAAIWDMVVAEYMKKAVSGWDASIQSGTFKEAYAKAIRIQRAFREIEEDGGGPDIPGPRNALAGSIVGYGDNTYGNVFKSDGVLEGKFEGALINSTGDMADYFSHDMSSLLPQKLSFSGAVNMGDVASGVATVLKNSPDQATQDAGYMLGILTTATTGLIGGGAGLVFAPALIYSDMFEKIITSLDDAALEAHFMARYYLATHYPDSISGMTLPSGALDLFFGLPSTLNGNPPIEARLLTAAYGFAGRRDICETESSTNCLAKEKLDAAYKLADFLAVVSKLNPEPLKKELAGYALAAYVAQHSFQLDVSPSTTGTVFQISIPDPSRTSATSTDWNWTNGTMPGFGGSAVFSGELNTSTSNFLMSSVGVWVSYSDGLKRYGHTTLVRDTALPPENTNVAPVLSNQSIFFHPFAANIAAVINPNFIDDGARYEAYVRVTQSPACGTLRTSAQQVLYLLNTGSACTTDQFKWVITDDQGLVSNEAVVSIQIVTSPASNTAPEVSPVSISVEQGKAVTFSLSATDAQQKPEQLVFTSSAPLYGTLKPTGVAPNQFKYTHAGGNTPSETLTYSVSDGSLSDSAALTITITPPPDHLPYAKGQVASVAAGQEVRVQLDGGDEDVADQPNLVWSILTQPKKGTATLNGSSLTYIHTASDAQGDSLQWQVRDTVKNIIAKATLGITVINRQPVIKGINNYPATSGTPISVNLVAIDPDGGAITWQLASGSPGQITGSTWSNTFTQSGVYSVKVIASDPYTTPENSPSRTFTIIVDGACEFTDVPASSPNHTIICAATGKQWIVGYTENNQLVFKPNQAITRAEFAKLAYMFLAEDRGITPSTGSATYADVPALHGMFTYIQTLTDMGLLSGYGDGTFKPDQALTRAEMALLINRITGWGTAGVDTQYQDVPFAPPAGFGENAWQDIYLAVGQLANHGIVSKTVTCANDATSVCFRPNDGLTRLEALLVLDRLPKASADQLLDDIASAPSNSGTWTDPETGLTWMRCAMGQKWTGNSCSGSGLYFATIVQAKALTGNVTFAGQNDWRLPNIRELQSILNRSVTDPSIDRGAFPGAESAIFWSDSPSATHIGGAWLADFTSGNIVESESGDGSVSVRLVRGGVNTGLLNPARPSIDYIDRGNGTVVHKPTGLMWKRCAEGSRWTGVTCTASAIGITWDSAKMLNAPFGGYGDWRLPSEEELLSLTDYTSIELPLANQDVFSETWIESFWSGTPAVGDSPYGESAWIVWSNGMATPNLTGTNKLGVRLVRNVNGPETAGGMSLLSTYRFGSGSGTITSNPVGIACGSLCETAFVASASVRLSANPANGSSFVGWSGACSGTGDCVVDMSESRGVTALFSAPSTMVDVGKTLLAAGGGHMCVLTNAGGVKCLGDNNFGQLGDSTYTGRSSPADVSGLTSGVKTITTGEYFACAVTASGAAKCWGQNSSGQLGDNSTTNRPLPVTVSGLSSGVASISGGRSHTCALTTVGSVKCWGNNGSGQLGNDTQTGSLTPVDVIGLGGGVAAISAGRFFTCALTTSGGVKCWGNNNDGAIGDDSNTARLTPVDVVGLSSGVIAIAAGDGNLDRGDYGGSGHACALTSAGGVKCWGANWFGELGNGETGARSSPQDVVGLTSGVKAIAASQLHSCALTTAGGVKCWGYNAMGQLGDNSTTDRTTPVDVVGLSSGVVAIATGQIHTCALTDTGLLKCWGRNGTGANITTPVDVANFGDLVATAYPVTVARAGSGSGTITSMPSGINCGSTCSKNFDSGSSVTLTASPVAGSIFSGWSGACSGTGSCTVTLTAARSVTASFTINSSVTPSLSFAAGWNLSGNGSATAIDVAGSFGDQSKVTTVWKWLTASGSWAFYAPSLDGAQLADYVASKGYTALDTINSGEGFWVNAKVPFTATVNTGSAVTTGQLASSLVSGWNLVAVGELAQAPSQFNAALGYNVTSLWAWDNVLSKWYFYTPTLDSSGLSNYINSHFYLDFTQKAKTLGWGAGFWVRKP